MFFRLELPRVTIESSCEEGLRGLGFRVLGFRVLKFRVLKFRV